MNRLSIDECVPADSVDDMLDEGLTGVDIRAPDIFEDSEVLLVQRSVKEDYRQFVASTNFPEIRAKRFSGYLAPFLVT